MTLSLLVLIFALCILQTLSDFVYKDFNETAGLTFNGDAGTSSCFNISSKSYGDKQGIADVFSESVLNEIGETTVLISESTVTTNDAKDNNITQFTLAGFIHRADTETSPTECKVRSRLTPSGPSKAGSMWFLDPAPVINGFETNFTFQITDHSKQCTKNVDQYFSLNHHLTCSVHGADGFAFVIQLQDTAANSTSCVGGVGGQMGFGGIGNSLAIAFDTWQNQGQDTVGVDHISVQSRGLLPNDALEEGLLGVPRAVTLADGKVHMARITYFSDLRTEYLDKLIASPSLLPYLKDNGEQKRIGTLVVFLDDMITPILALPINLSLLLSLPIDKAYVGFTASTGRFYEKHDILSWSWCDQPPCDPNKLINFDYHQQSKQNKDKLRTFSPGEGYGGGDTTEGFPIKNKSPDTTAWALPLSSFSETRNMGLAEDNKKQVPFSDDVNLKTNY